MITKQHDSGQISASLIKHSVSEFGDTIATYELEYPRFIHCFDKDTEILSQINDEPPKFRSFYDVFGLNAKVAQYDKCSEEISFVVPDEKISNTGDHKMISLDKKKFPLMVTDGHRVFTHKRTTGNAFINDTILASELTGNYGTRRIPQSGYVKSNQKISDAEIEFCVWFAADGHTPKYGDQANFHFKKYRKVSEVERILMECGFDYKTIKYGDDYVIRFDKNGFTNSCYNEYGEKILPDESLSMTADTYLKFKNALLLSDGNIDNCEYNSTSEDLINQIQVVAHSNGDSINIRKYGSMFKCSFKKESYISLRHDKDNFIETLYNGTVYCVTVPSSYVLVRREGVAFVSGNCELMTHRVFSRNAMSSRAVPISKMIEQVRANPAMPIHWGKNQAGMQASEEMEYPQEAKFTWMIAAESASEDAEYLSKIGLHKQVVNRILEPFQRMKTIVTATEYSNFFELRCHKDAQPEIKVLAELMRDCMEESEPQLLKAGEWHIPYIQSQRCSDTGILYYYLDENTEIDLQDALKVSSSCCAQVSYRLLDNSLYKALMIYDKLIESKPIHASPFEHQAKVMSDNVDQGVDPWDNGVTHIDRGGLFWSGNFKGWIQYRQLLGSN